MCRSSHAKDYDGDARGVSVVLRSGEAADAALAGRPTRTVTTYIVV
jgi:hypothetical protein